MATEPKSAASPFLRIENSTAFGFGLYNKTAFSEKPGFRFGLLIERHRIELQTSQFNSNHDSYSATNFLFDTEYSLFPNKIITVELGLALGMGFLSDNIPCNELFCNFPDIVVLAWPGLKGSIRVYKHNSINFSLYRGEYLTDNKAVFPFKSGFMYSIGVEVKL